MDARCKAVRVCMECSFRAAAAVAWKWETSARPPEFHGGKDYARRNLWPFLLPTWMELSTIPAHFLCEMPFFQSDLHSTKAGPQLLMESHGGSFLLCK